MPDHAQSSRFTETKGRPTPIQLEILLSAADPARQAQIDEADSPLAAALYRRIVGIPPSHEGGAVPRPTPRRTPHDFSAQPDAGQGEAKPRG